MLLPVPFSEVALWRRIGAIAMALIGGILLFVPAIAVVFFRFYGADFVPSQFLKPSASIFALAVFAVTLVLFFALQARDIRTELQRGCYAGVAKSAAKNIVISVVLGSLWYSFFAYPLGYLLHQRSLPERAQVDAQVEHSNGIGRVSCRYEAVLEGDTYFWQRRLCGISREDHLTLQTGGVLEVTGTVSQYGMLVSSYVHSRRSNWK